MLAAQSGRTEPIRKSWISYSRCDIIDSPSKMVYYPSTPLIIKTEQSSQEQFCTPLRATTSATAATSNVHQQMLPIHAQQQNSMSTVTQHYNNQNNDTIILQHQPKQKQHQHQHQLQLQLQQQQQHQSQPISITKNSNGNGYQQQQPQQQQQQQNYLLTSIKAEQLPPSITLYATTSGNETQPVETVEHTTSVATLRNATATGGGRKSAAAGIKPQFKCEQCGMTFGSKSAHTSHTKSHAKTNEMSAAGGGNVSGISLPTNAAAQISLVEINEAGMPVGIPKVPQITPIATGGSDPYQCNVCQKTFAVPARLIRHYRTHTGERPFECEFCHKLFSVKENLQVHRRIHTKERPYKCDVCGRAFEHSGKLHRHMRIHTGERPHKCSVCEKTFIQSGQLVIHMRTHTGEKPYKCPVEGCGKGFTCSKQLKVHSRTHTGEKPYQCDICYRDFGYNHVLKLHRVQHYGSKCYKCTICDKTFKSKKEMEAHIKGHANEMPDDDDEGAVVATSAANCGPVSSPSSSGGELTNSSPGSPHSPVLNVNYANITKARKPRQPRMPRTAVANVVNATQQPPSPSSPSSTYSPPSSVASASRLSAGSPPSPAASPDTAHNSVTIVPIASNQTLETDMQYNSRDSGVVTNYSASIGSQCHLNLMSTNATASTFSNVDDLPTDLSIGQQHAQPKVTTNYYHQIAQQSSPTHYTYMRQRSPSSSPAPMSEAPTINPALLEAATIAREEEAALQIMQLCRSAGTNVQQMLKPQPAHSNADLATTANSAAGESELVQQNEDLHEANELIAHYKRGELARHGLHKRYAPVPKFESTLLSNENLVRKVEAAIAPLRSSTESPERSSSPECDSIILVSDRDVMTLPLRKRKLYMQEEQPKNGDHLKTTHNQASIPASGANDNNVASQKVMRMSSVIQFAKAS